MCGGGNGDDDGDDDDDDDDDSFSLESFEDDDDGRFFSLGRRFFNNRQLVGGGTGDRGFRVLLGGGGNAEGRGIGVGGLRSRGNFGTGFPVGGRVTCNPGEVLNAVGRCQQAVVSRKVYFFDAPDIPAVVAPPPNIPPPKVDYNYVFLRAPKQPEPLEPIVVPPPKKKTVLFPPVVRFST